MCSLLVLCTSFMFYFYVLVVRSSKMNFDQGIMLHQEWRRFNNHTSCFSHPAEGHMTGSGNGRKNPI